MKHILEEIKAHKVIRTRPFFVKAKVVEPSGSPETAIKHMTDAALHTSYPAVLEALEYYKKLLGVFMLVFENPNDPRISERTLQSWAEKYKGRIDPRFVSKAEITAAYETLEELVDYTLIQKMNHPIPPSVELPVEEDPEIEPIVDEVEEDPIVAAELADLFADLDEEPPTRGADAPNPFDEVIEGFSDELVESVTITKAVTYHKEEDFTPEEIASFEDAEDNGFDGIEEEEEDEPEESFSEIFEEAEQPVVTSALRESINSLANITASADDTSAPSTLSPLQALLQSPNTAERRIFRASGRKYPKGSLGKKK